jgi:hypothetical protein
MAAAVANPLEVRIATVLSPQQQTTITTTTTNLKNGQHAEQQALLL